MSDACVHDFHFVIDRRMKDRLASLNCLIRSQSLSGIMLKILQLLTPLIRNEHKWGQQRLSRYKSVCDDPDEIRDHVHVYVPNELYRELKLLHQDLNFYSIAQMVREFFDFFFGFVDVYENDVMQELEKLFTHWKLEDEQIQQTPRKFMRQLWKIIRHLPGKNRLVNVYNNNFSPFWILRI